MTFELHISDLYVYPVKSLAGMKVESFSLDRFGPVADRRWMVVNVSGKFLTQRQKKHMAMIHAVVKEQNGIQLLSLSAPEGKTFELAIDLDRSHGERIPVTVWSDTCDAIEESKELSAWMSDLLQLECRIVFMPKTTVRAVDLPDAQGDQTVGFADGFPLLIATKPSLAEFCARLGKSIEMVRFRPNIVLDGCAPFAEDDWARLKVRNIAIDIVKPCARCVIPSINPETAVVEPEVTETLRRFRRRGTDLLFGQNAIHRQEGKIAVGDRVAVEA